ncbi:MAG: hypothetical protein K2X39_06725 [Silvanigrellaceae bacterium]|nr:hypothetical protein [Silvanigrellaceae bacterium]
MRTHQNSISNLTQTKGDRFFTIYNSTIYHSTNNNSTLKNFLNLVRIFNAAYLCSSKMELIHILMVYNKLSKFNDFNINRIISDVCKDKKIAEITDDCLEVQKEYFAKLGIHPAWAEASPDKPHPTDEQKDQAINDAWFLDLRRLFCTVDHHRMAKPKDSDEAKKIYDDKIDNFKLLKMIRKYFHQGALSGSLSVGFISAMHPDVFLNADAQKVVIRKRSNTEYYCSHAIWFSRYRMQTDNDDQYFSPQSKQGIGNKKIIMH